MTKSRVIKIKEKQFIKTTTAIKNNKTLYNVIKFLYKILPLVLFLGYPIMVIYLVAIWDLRFIKVLTIPAVTFLAVTVMRILINRPRPYEKYSFTPVFPKDTKGKSFPSRHTASAFIISYAFLYINPVLGIISMVISAFLSLLRPVVGVHYVSDVLGGFLVSSVLGIVFFFII
ncbi:MAG: phosphatase PAP2 family protein [Oscillospiraceae bacterium]|nr:phosphatase PAP2 family protein [Oscillospiraceae bacterium]